MFKVPTRTFHQGRPLVELSDSNRVPNRSFRQSATTYRPKYRALLLQAAGAACFQDLDERLGIVNCEGSSQIG